MRSPHVASASIVLAFVLLASGSTEAQEAIEEDISDSAPTVTVTASTLFSDYDSNEVAADDKYKGKILNVSGTIDDIGKDITDTMYVTLKTANPILNVQCFFADDHKSQVANASKGQQVTIKGKCDGKFGNVLIRGCSFE